MLDKPLDVIAGKAKLPQDFFSMFAQQYRQVTQLRHFAIVAQRMVNERSRLAIHVDCSKYLVVQGLGVDSELVVVLNRGVPQARRVQQFGNSRPRELSQVAATAAA